MLRSLLALWQMKNFRANVPMKSTALERIYSISEDYHAEYDAAFEDGDGFWADRARHLLSWSKEFSRVHSGDFGSDCWFEDGVLNACYNCVDRWVNEMPDKIALIFNNNEGEVVEFSYSMVQKRVYQICHALSDLKAGDCVTCYFAMSPEAVFTALACARLGIVHNFVFGGFAAESLRERIIHTDSKMVIAQDLVVRGEKLCDFKAIVEEAVQGLNKDISILIFDKQVEKSKAAAESGANKATVADKTSPAATNSSPDSPAIYTSDQNSNKNLSLNEHKSASSFDEIATLDSICNSPILPTFKTHAFEKGRKVTYWSEVPHSSSPVPCCNVPAEHPLFFLYTSGTTGNPKGLLHTTAGYLTYVAYSMKMAFNIKKDDIFCSTADIGWITGHSYGVYAPLALGITSVIVEGIPSYPSFYRFFDIIHKTHATHLYTAPTIIRNLKAHFDKHTFDISAFDLSSLRFLGSVGEPINAEAYGWFSRNFNNCKVIDTYFQTETGGILIAPVHGAGPVPPCSAGFPLPGIVPLIKELESNKTLGRFYIARSWPGMARGIHKNKQRWFDTYFPSGSYFTGDKALANSVPGSSSSSQCIYTLQGRADDEINVSGHRINTAGVESAACANPLVAEAAVVPLPHPIKGTEMLLFVVLKTETKNYAEEIATTINQKLGGFCRPGHIVSVAEIPKTATGKIMRRVITTAVNGGDLKDISTCINAESIESIKKAWQKYNSTNSH